MTRFRLTLFAVILAAVLWLDPIWVPLVPVGLFMPVFVNCTIFEDDFSTDRTGTDYTVVSGTWSVGSGVLTTSSTGALIVENTAGTTGHGRVRVIGKTSAANGTFAVVGAYVDSNTYVYAEVTINGTSSTLKLWNKTGPTQIGLTATFHGIQDTPYLLELCWNGSEARASIDANADVVYGAYAGTGNRAGMAASPNSGTSTFDGFTFDKHADDDETCESCGPPCSACHDNDGPAVFDVEITGLTNGASCSNCPDLNGLYSVPQVRYCFWKKADPCPQPVSCLMDVAVSAFTTGGEYFLQVRLDVIGGTCGASRACVFQKNYGATPPDCLSLSSESIPFDHSDNTLRCDWSTAAVTVTSVP